MSLENGLNYKDGILKIRMLDGEEPCCRFVRRLGAAENFWDSLSFMQWDSVSGLKCHIYPLQTVSSWALPKPLFSYSKMSLRVTTFEGLFWAFEWVKCIHLEHSTWKSLLVVTTAWSEVPFRKPLLRGLTLGRHGGPISGGRSQAVQTAPLESIAGTPVWCRGHLGPQPWNVRCQAFKNIS